MLHPTRGAERLFRPAVAANAVRSQRVVPSLGTDALRAVAAQADLGSDEPSVLRVFGQQRWLPAAQAEVDHPGRESQDREDGGDLSGSHRQRL